MRVRANLAHAAVVAAFAASAYPLCAVSRELPNFDALARLPASEAAAPGDAVRALTTAPTQATLEPRLGVPKFLWGADVRDTLAASPEPKQVAQDDEGRARAYLRKLASLYRISASEIDALPLRSLQRFPAGGAAVRFRNEIDGVEVFREAVNVILDARGDLVAVGGFAMETPIAARKTTRLATEAAIAAALADYGFAGEIAQALVRTHEEGGYAFYSLPSATPGAEGALLAAPVRAKRVWFRLPNELTPAWYVEVQMRDGASRNVAAHAYVVSAVDGSLLFRNNLMSDAAFGYRVFAEAAPPHLPLPGPGARGAFPHPTGNPDGFQPPHTAANLVTLENAPFSRNDPWLSSSATRTIGNNVEAYLSLSDPDGFGPAASDECNLALAVDGDMHACVTSVNAFDHAYNPGVAPDASRSQIAAAVTNLFYTINYLHDFFYDAGFDEASGNAQSSNYGRGGLGNDSIFAEVQDFSANNNASMTTPADGQRPRMRMHLWTGGVSLLKVNLPAPIAGVKTSNTAAFGPQGFDLTANVALALDAANPEGPTNTDGCTPFTNAAEVAGRIAAIDRGVCLFVVKVRNAQDAGAIGVVIFNNVATGAPGMSGDDPSITIPVLSLSLADGNAIKLQLSQSAVSVRLARQSTLPRDGSLDNTLVAHEWGHYLSNRLINDGNGLSANQARGMGEGWSDFVSLLLLVKDGDRALPANADFGGVYTETPYPLAGPDYAPDVINNAYYYGIRRYPYTRDLSKHPLTFRHIADGVPLPPAPPISPQGSTARNGEEHNAGEVWAAMLWECYSNLLNDGARLTFAQAQERTKRYLVAGYKMMPIDPTFVTARDAILAVMAAQDARDRELCLHGFAKRGLGVGAIAPDSASADNVGLVESFRTVLPQGGVIGEAIEFYHQGFDHYFASSAADEIAKLDNGTLAGWIRTGERFRIYTNSPAGSADVCRFFSTAFGVRSSHFYTLDPNECGLVKVNPNWQLESSRVFGLLASGPQGDCPAGSDPIYRLYNEGQGGAPNHRYTTSLATRATMLGRGWIPEGHGPLGVIMCAPV